MNIGEGRRLPCGEPEGHSEKAGLSDKRSYPRKSRRKDGKDEERDLSTGLDVRIAVNVVNFTKVNISEI